MPAAVSAARFALKLAVELWFKSTVGLEWNQYSKENSN